MCGETLRDVIRCGDVAFEVVQTELRHGVVAKSLRQTEGEPLTRRQLRLLADELGLVVSGGRLAGAGVAS
jgi:hypothetical protein